MKGLLYGFFIIFLMTGISSCSSLARVYLYNAHSDQVAVNVLVQKQGGGEYLIEPNKVGEIYLDLLRESRISVIVSGKKKCFEFHPVGNEWVEIGLWRSTAHALISQNSQIFLYTGKSDKKSYFKEAPPRQPSHYPLEAVDCGQSPQS